MNRTATAVTMTLLVLFILTADFARDGRPPATRLASATTAALVA